MLNQIKKVEAIATEIDGTVRPDYSGRGMFGKTCFGIYCNNVTECLEVAGSHGLRGAKYDNMGKGYIVYWPGITN